ncbi:MAG TPA: hypothetical protein VLE95_01435 [Chlamydiales bacterium]|nr:hypothetical protein [Chlamydiales bacterium]
MPSEQIFPFGAEGKGGTPPLPRRKREKMAEGIEYPMNKPIIQVNSFLWHIFRKIWSENYGFCKQ